MIETGIALFANGYEWDNWNAANCSRCWKDSEPTACPFYNAIGDSMVNGGYFSPEIAARFQWKPEYRAVLGWPCPEREETPPPPKPAHQVMAEAGMPTLPGFES